MAVYLVVLLSLLTSISQRGAKVAVSLYALELGAGSLLVGVLAALFAAFPLLLAVHAGRISDRFGMRAPIFAGCVVMAIGLVLPTLNGSLPVLLACASLAGLGHIFFHVSIHNLVGSLDEGERTKNFATFALGGSVAAFIGPSAAGFGIEIAGYRPTFALLAALAALPALLAAALALAANRRRASVALAGAALAVGAAAGALAPGVVREVAVATGAAVAALALVARTRPEIPLAAALLPAGCHAALVARGGPAALSVGLAALVGLAAVALALRARGPAVAAVVGVALVGTAAHAAQLAGMLPAHALATPRLDLLGLFPTVETIAAQLVVVALALVARRVARARR